MEFTNYYGRRNAKKFDLSGGNFFTRLQPSGGHGNANDWDVGITLGGKGKNRQNILFSLKKGTKKKISEADRVVFGIVEQYGEERLYVIEDDNGYKASVLEHSNRKQVKASIGDNRKLFEKYIGYHNFKYDADNKAYYVTVGE